jgi:hypothetical protein
MLFQRQSQLQPYLVYYVIEAVTVRWQSANTQVKNEKWLHTGSCLASASACSCIYLSSEPGIILSFLRVN